MSPTQGLRKLEKEDLLSFARIVANAYPSMRITTDEELQKYVERMRKYDELDPRVDYYGFYRAGQLLGGFYMFGFEMNLWGTLVKAGGIGTLAVDLLHKKEKVAKETVLAALRHFRREGMPVAVLYPFRPDFYRKMGFGYGTKMNRYSLRPGDLPGGGSKDAVFYLTRDDIEGIRACYARYFEKNHGMMAKPEAEIARMFDNPKIKVVGCKRDGNVTGYMVFSFKQDAQDRFLLNDLAVIELVYDTRDDLAQFMAFLRSQADQIRRVVIDTQDEFFHFLPWDPRNGSDDIIPSVYHVTNTQGVGLMYRVLDVARIFSILKEHNFGGQTCVVKFVIEDGFFPENGGPVVVSFDRGAPTVLAGSEIWDVEVKMSVSEFSSLLMGSIGFSSLYAYNLAHISDEGCVDAIDRLFRGPKPVCLTAF